MLAQSGPLSLFFFLFLSMLEGGVMALSLEVLGPGSTGLVIVVDISSTALVTVAGLDEDLIVVVTELIKDSVVDGGRFETRDVSAGG